MLRNKNEKNNNSRKGLKKQQLRTKLDKQINDIKQRDKTENNQLQKALKAKQISIKRLRTKIDINRY